jgi:hypothetical protein
LWIDQGRPPYPHPTFVARKDAKKYLRRTQRQLEADKRAQLYNKVTEASNRNDPVFFGILNRMRQCTPQNHGSQLRINGSTISQSAEVLEAWASHFENLGTPQLNPRFDTEYKQFCEEEVLALEILCSRERDLPCDRVSVEEVAKAIKRLNNKKAPDQEGLSAEHLKAAGPIITPLLADLFTAMLQSRHIPAPFKTGTVLPILKKRKDPLDPGSYRGITITSVLGKALENIILDRMSPHQSQSQLQFGFTKGKSPLMAALLSSEVIAEGLDTKRPTYIAALDAQKAFDVVDHAILKTILYEQCHDSKVWAAETALLDGLSASVRLNGTFSRTFQLKQGVGQGKVLSPTQYKVYVNNTLTEMEEANLGAFIGTIYTGILACADDIMLHSQHQRCSCSWV